MLSYVCKHNSTTLFKLFFAKKELFFEKNSLILIFFYNYFREN